MQRFISLLMIVILLSSCSGLGGEDALPTIAPVGNLPSTDESGPVQISFGISEYERSNFEPLIEAFQAENPNIRVVLVSLDDAYSNYESEAGALRWIVSQADAFSTSSYYVSPEMYNSNLFLDLKPLMDADPNFQRDDFHPGVLDFVTVDNRIAVLPQYLYIQALTYNKDLLAQANIPEPSNDWTWNDLIGAAEQLAQARNGESIYGFQDLSDGLISLAYILEQANVNLLKADLQTGRLDTPEIAQAIERVRALQQKAAVFTSTRPESNVTDADIETVVAQGRIGFWNDMYITPPSDGGATTSYEKVTIPYPRNGGFMEDIGASDGYMISSGTQYPNAAWKLIEFLSRQTSNQENMWWSSNRLPSRESVAQQSGYWETLEPQTASAYKWILANRPRTEIIQQPNYALFYGLMDVVQDAIRNPQANINQLLQTAQTKYENAVAEQLLTPTPTVDTSPVVVATPVIDVVPEGATVIKFLSSNYNVGPMRRLARSFQQEHPDIFVEMTSLSSLAEYPNLQTLSQQYDCFDWYEAPKTDSDFAGLLNLRPLFDADASFQQNDYPIAVIQAFEHQGGIYGLPQFMNFRTLNYNRLAFEAAGIELPNNNWTHNDLLSAAQTLTTGTGDQKIYGYLPLSEYLFELAFFANTYFNARLSTGSGEQIRANFADPKVIEAIQWYLSLSTVHQVAPEIVLNYNNANVSRESRVWDYANDGRGAIWMGYGPTFNYLNNSLSFPFEEAVTMMPVGNQGINSNLLNVQGMYIAANSQNSQMCWQWLKYLSNSSDPEVLQGGYPARTSIAESSAYTSQADADQLAGYQAHREILQRAPAQSDSVDEINDLLSTYWLYQALDQHLNQNVDLGQALEQAQNTSNAYADCLVQNGKPYKRATCAKQVDPSYDGYYTEDDTE